MGPSDSQLGSGHSQTLSTRMCVLARAGVIRLPIATGNSVHIATELTHFNLVRRALPTGRRSFDHHLVFAPTTAANQQKSRENEDSTNHLRRMRRGLRFVNMSAAQNYSVAAKYFRAPDISRHRDRVKPWLCI